MTGLTPEVTIVIVTWNSSRYIRDCLQSIYDFTRKNQFEVLVIDNDSTDDTVEAIRSGFQGVKLIRAGSNLGFPRANNVALRQARGRNIFLLNPDTRFECDVIAHLTGFLQGTPQAGAVSPKILEADGSIARFSIRELPSLSSSLFTQFGLRKLFPRSRLFGKGYLVGWDRDSVRAVPYLAGAALMIPRELLFQVGFLDEQIPMYFEDLDLCARIAAAGRVLYCVPSAVLVHLGGRSAELSPVRPLLYALECGHAPWLYFRTYRGRAHAAFFTAIMLLGNSLRLLLFQILAALSPLRGREASNRTRQDLAKSRALMRWSISPKRRFASRLGSIFPGYQEGESQ